MIATKIYNMLILQEINLFKALIVNTLIIKIHQSQHFFYKLKIFSIYQFYLCWIRLRQNGYRGLPPWRLAQVEC